MSPTIVDSAWRSRAAQLAETLANDGVFTDPRWRAAIEQIPRHVFVPRFHADDGTVLDGSDPTGTEAWLSAVYSDDSLVVQRATVPGNGHGWPTSSSTMPSLMVRMLQLLEVADDSRVLEIGTATGYNAALLCHRLGAERVASIELHPQLAADAAARLITLGYRPTLAVGDGAEGVPAAGPFDRILATCSAPTVPRAWIEQLAPGGRIVTDLQSGLSSSLAVLGKTAPDMVSGRLLEQPGYFMSLRSDLDSALSDPARYDFTVDLDTAVSSLAEPDSGVLGEPGLRVLLGVLEPTLNAARGQRDGVERWWLDAEGGSWAEILSGTVTQGGPRRLWPMVQHAVAEWRRLGQPGRGRYGVTVRTDGGRRLWVDTPDNLVAGGGCGSPAG